MKLLIALFHRLPLWMPPEWLAPRLRRDFPQLEVVQIPNYDSLDRELPHTDIAIAWSIRPEQFANAKRLKWIHSTAAAVHQLLYPALVNSDVLLTNARSVHGAVVAEHTIALLMALAKKIPSAVRYQQQKFWAQETLWNEQPRTRELRGSTICVIGFGAIGREVAERCHALGMRVLAVREHSEQASPPAERVFAFGDMNTALRQSDFVVLAVPVTPSTTKFFDTDRFAAMMPQAYLVNVGRGVLIDEPAMIHALASKKIGGAALDVFTEEPLPADSPLWSMPNVLITPHTAGMSEQMWERHHDLISENLSRFFSGRPLLGLVNKVGGY